MSRRERHLLVDDVGNGIGTFFASGDASFFCNTSDEQIAFEKDSGRTIALVRTADGKPARAVRVTSTGLSR